MNRQLEFENGRLVKIDGVRPDYMDGYKLISIVREMALEIAYLRQAVHRYGDKTRMSFAEPTGLQQAIDRAMQETPKGAL